MVLWKILGIFSGEHKNIDDWCYAYDEVDLGLIWGVIKYLHWETKWLIDSMINEDFFIVLIMMLEDFEIGASMK